MNRDICLSTTAAVLLGACLALSVSLAYAAGDSSSETPTCSKGQIWDAKLKNASSSRGAWFPTRTAPIMPMRSPRTAATMKRWTYWQPLRT